MRGAVFLDRDGVINENRDDYVRSWDDFEFIPGSLEAIARLSRAGWPIIVVTNQSAIGRGVVERAVVEEIHDRMRVGVSEAGGTLTLVSLCPHHPDDCCVCRKPAPGMLREAAERLEIDLSRSYLVGDHMTDIDAALAAGCRPILALTGRGEESLAVAQAQGRTDFVVAANLSEAVNLILDEKAVPRV